MIGIIMRSVVADVLLTVKKRIVEYTTLRGEFIYQDGQSNAGPLGQPILKAQAA